MKLFTQVQKEREEKADNFEICSDGKRDDECILEGEEPYEDMPPLADWEDEWAGQSGEGFDEKTSQAGASQASSFALGDQKQTFFPSSKPKAKVAMSSAKSNPTVKRDQALSFPNGKLVDEKIDINPWPSIIGFRNWKLSFKKKVASAPRFLRKPSLGSLRLRRQFPLRT